jgi:Flp pilus assembly protein CpaB
MRKIRIAIVSGLIAVASVAGVVAHGAAAAPQPRHAVAEIDCCLSAKYAQS